MHLTRLLLLLALLTSCSASRSLSTDSPTWPPTHYAPHDAALQRDSLAQLPAYLVPAPAGSTARQRRQWQKAQAENLARAGHSPASVKIKNSSVATGAGSTAINRPKGTVATDDASVTNAQKARAPVATGTSKAQDFTKAGQRGGAVATEPGASAGVASYAGVSPWALAGGGLVILLLLLLGLAYKFRTKLLGVG
jgi:hypothetical protein